jgi:signal peptidase II
MKKTKYIIGIILIFIIDQITKIIINSTINLNESITIIKNFFKLTYTHNYGAAFGIFGGKTIFILIISFIILIYLLFELFKHKKGSTIINIGIMLIIGGLLGNLVDRMFLGYVRDFLDFKILSWDFAIFNIGDIAIVLGAITFSIGILLEGKNEYKNN